MLAYADTAAPSAFGRTVYNQRTMLGALYIELADSVNCLLDNESINLNCLSKSKPHEYQFQPVVIVSLTFYLDFD